MGRDLSGVGVYSREILHGLAAEDPDTKWEWLYRTHRLREGLTEGIPANVRRGVLFDSPPWRAAQLFHSLNQRLPRKRFPKQVATFHDVFVMTADYSTPEFRARFTAQAKHAAAEADRIIAVSHFTASQVIELLGVEPARITVIPHGVRELQLPARPREKIILHVGAIQKRKNLVRLVKAFESVPMGWRLVLAGSDGYEARETHAAIEASPARQRIEVTGYVSHAQLADLYARAMIFAFPSLGEGFGMPVLEAMISGVPVMAANTSAVAETAGASALLVDPLDTEEMASALYRLADEAPLRDQLIQSGIVHARGFTWNAAAAATLAIYDGLV